MHLGRTIIGLMKVSFTIIMGLIKAQERACVLIGNDLTDVQSLLFIYQACHVQVQSMTDNIAFYFKTYLVLLGFENITFRYFTNCCIPLNLTRICLRNWSI